MNLLIISIVIVALLLMVGTIQRKALALWFRSEAKEIISNNTNTVKVARLQLSDMKAKIKVLIDQAGLIFALEEQQKKERKAVELQITILLREAKEAKEADNTKLAKEKLKLKLENEKQLTLIDENITTLTNNRGKLEANIQKIKTFVAKNNIRIKGVEARKQVNNLIKSSAITNIDGETLEESIDTLDIKVEGEEIQLDYVTKFEDSKEEEYSAVVDKEFDSL